MYSIAICEDNEQQLNHLITMLRRYEQLNETPLTIDYFGSAELFTAANKYDYDLIFLDVKLPGMNGLELARRIRATSTKIKLVFLTAYQDFWPEGYKVLASRYLVKPLEEESFFYEFSNLLKEIDVSQQWIIVNHDKSLAKVPLEDILYLEILGRKVLIHTEDGDYISSQSLSYWVKKLECHSFVQTHSSFLVNLKFVKLVEKDKVILTTGDEVYMSTRKYKKFKDCFIAYVSQH